MKKYFILLLVLIVANCNSQDFAIFNPSMNILYSNISNPISVFAKDFNCDSIFLSTNNGTITTESCHNFILPKNSGTATIFINKKQFSDTIIIGKELFRVKEIPKPIPKIANRKGGPISKSNLKAQIGIITVFEVDIDVHIDVLSYSVIILRGKVVTFTESVIGNKLTASFKQNIENIIEDDQVIFTNIKAKMPDGEKNSLDSMIFTIEK